MTTAVRPTAELLRERLRSGTRTLHHDLERASGLPRGLRTAADARSWLARQHRLVVALEDAAGLPALRSARLAAALALVDVAAIADRDDLPPAPTTVTPAWRAGVAWVLVGADAGLTVLGGRVGRLLPVLADHPALQRDVGGGDTVTAALAEVPRAAHDDAVAGAVHAFTVASAVLGSSRPGHATMTGSGA